MVPTTNEPVVEVSGAFDVHAEINGFATNNNAVFAEIGLPDPAAAFGNQGWDGLVPRARTTTSMSSCRLSHLTVRHGSGGTWLPPKLWTTANGTTIAATQLTLNPTMGPAEAAFWINEITDYTAPRLAVSLVSLHSDLVVR